MTRTARAAAGRTRTSGFTLTEMLVAMALLATLGAFLVQLVRGSFDLYRQGDRRGDLYHNALLVLDVLEDDLRAVHAGADGRLLLRPEQGDALFLRLVRSIPGGELDHPHLRHAGTLKGAAETYAGKDPGLSRQPEIAPPVGLMEVAYKLVHEPDDPPGIMTLYRGTFAPALGKGGFFAPDEDTTFDDAWARQTLRPVTSDILGLWILCLGQSSAEWAEDDVMDGRVATQGATLSWDSTRGIFDREVFPLARGAASLADPRDDVFPRQVRILLHVARGGLPEARLRRSLPKEGDLLEVNSTRELPGPEEEDRHVKIADEWLRLGEMDASGAKVARGRRGTVAARGKQDVGTPVYAGRLFRKTMELPSYRSFFVPEEGR